MEVGKKTLEQNHVALVPEKGTSRKGEAAPGRSGRRPVSHRHPIVQSEIPGEVDELLLGLSGNSLIGLGPDLSSIFPEMLPEYGIDKVEASFQVQGKPGSGKSTVDDPAGLENRFTAGISRRKPSHDSRCRDKFGHLPEERLHLLICFERR